MPGQMLKAARKACGLSVSELATRSGLPTNLIKNIELRSHGDAGELGTLARTLGGTFDDLLSGWRFWEAPALALRHSDPTLDIAIIREGVLRTASAGRIATELWAALGLPNLWKDGGRLLGPRSLKGNPALQAEKLASQVRQRLGNPEEPFASVRSAIRPLGVMSFLAEFPDRVDGATWRFASGAPVVVANPRARAGLVTALRLTIAHELCHALYDRPKSGPAGLVEMRTEYGAEIEQRANAFAVYFLAPRAAVSKYLAQWALGPSERPSAQHLISLSRHFGVGIEAMAWHLVSLGRWERATVEQHRWLHSPDFLSADDREGRAPQAEHAIPLERRGLVLDLATQALESGKISLARWRELVGVDLYSDWRQILTARHVELPPEA